MGDKASSFVDCLGNVHTFFLDELTHEDLIRVYNLGFADATELRHLDRGYTINDSCTRSRLEKIIEGDYDNRI